MAAIRRVHLVCFTVGLFFASFAWMRLVTPVGSLIDFHRYSLRDHVLSHTGAILVVSGYVVWAGWFVHAWKGEFLLRRPKSFFVLAYLHHVGWLFWFPFLRGTNVFEFAANLLPVFLWITTNMVIALTGFSLAIASEPLSPSPSRSGGISSGSESRGW